MLRRHNLKKLSKTNGRYWDGRRQCTKGEPEMARILISPSKYIQGAGEMKKLGTYAQAYGKKALILISKGGYKWIGADIEERFKQSECSAEFD